ncbi:MAG: hypothetical protein JWN42_2218 [Candidatus Angelobacter sp.]|nr:hypothetical protein [Candidatus Angelobacter sp.]
MADERDINGPIDKGVPYAKIRVVETTLQNYSEDHLGCCCI